MIPICTPFNTSHSLSRTEQDYATSKSLWVNTWFLKLKLVVFAALFIPVFKLELLLTIHVSIKARTHAHLYNYTKAEIQNSYFTTRHNSFLRRDEMLDITTFRCDCLSGEIEATGICSLCKVAVLSRIKVVSQVIHSTYF
jgi:hypothetical protein